MEILRPTQREQWLGVLSECPGHDFYHLPEYHAHAEQHGGGRAHLFVHREAGGTIALPLLLRRLEAVPELGTAAGDWLDATSVYGYAGPVASHAEISEAVQHRFATSLTGALRDLHVVTVFSRLHPLFEQCHLLAGLGNCAATGLTASLNLTPPPEAQFMKFRRDHRRDLKRLRTCDLEVVEDPGLEHFDRFVELYTHTMRRVNAAPQYFFSREYLTSLARNLGAAMRLFFVRQSGKFIAATLHGTYNGIVQSHLGGSAVETLQIAPDKLLIDDVRLWAAARGFRIFHHGGGVGGKQDGLFHFKAGFSDRTHWFYTWRWLVNPQANAALCTERTRWNRAHGLQPLADDFFPAYRAPATVTAETAEVSPGARSSLAGSVRAVLGTLVAGGLSTFALVDDELRKRSRPASSPQAVAPRALPHERSALTFSHAHPRRNPRPTAAC